MLSLKNLVLTVTLGLACNLVGATPAHAWHGFPPFGAWAYGTRGPGWSTHHFSTRTTWGGVYRSHYSASRFGSWYGYGWNAPLVSTPFCPPVIHRPIAVYRAPVVSYWSVSNYWPSTVWGYNDCWGYANPYPIVPSWYLPSYPVSYGAYVAPIYTPVINPVGVSVHSVGWPLANSTTTPTATGRGVLRQPAATAPTRYIAQASAASLEPHRVTPVTVSTPVPAELLDAADRILRAGGYREAAAAYARLTARYGSNPQLLGRRFVSQVLARDFEQAAVIAASARLLEQPLEQSWLPGGKLEGLGVSPTVTHTMAENLAEYAFARPTDAPSLTAVAFWLALAGKQETSSVFLRRADQLEANESRIAKTLETTPGRSKMTFVAVE
jgi:hypothetical protein